jgi:septation ring formation regulator EzrA
VAESECAAGDTKAARKQLKKVVRKLIQFSHRLRTKNARKNIPEDVREPLAETTDGIQEHARELKDTLSCVG